MSSDQCNRDSRIERNFTHFTLNIQEEHLTAPKDALQIDLVPALPPSGVYQKILTVMDVFSSYSFPYPTSNQDAKTIAEFLFNILTKHAYLPTTLISDKESAFVSHIVK